ncbi:MAG: undecaprenyl-phosphate glucose phosphotransferase [Bacteroidaceae bacterium]|nr:undecaprenyl-phosphate glucose phosphotransferase [Bacteroidaceae bacterium]
MGKDRNLIFAIMLADILLLATTIVGMYYLLEWIAQNHTPNTLGLPSLVGTYIISFLSSYALYPPIIQERIVKTTSILHRVTVTSTLMILIVSLLILLIYKGHTFPRTFLVGSYIVFTILLFAERIFIRKFFIKARSNKRNTKRVLLIGSDPTIAKLYKTLSHPAFGYDIMGAFYDEENADPKLQAIHIGKIDQIYEWLSKHSDIHEIYGYFPKEKQGLINIISKFCDNHLIRFYYVPAINIYNGKISFHFVEDIPVIARREEPLSDPLNKIAKRGFDLLCSTLFLLLIFPWIYIVVGIIIKITSPGPIFFIQERTGLNGKIFRCYKFRSMKVNNDADTLQATKDDPRKYPFGDFMRRTNIDELPQFINVFLGEMSMVGPRPHMLRHTEEYSRLINRFMVRHLAKPGITGLAQVSGFRGETKHIEDMEGRIKKDIEYIENWTFFLDIKIMVKTITNMLGGEKNAY